MVNNIFVFYVAQLGVKSVLDAAAVYPKPGLITPVNNITLNNANSATECADFFDMIDCAMALFPCLINYASIGCDTETLAPSDVLTLLEPVEIQGRKELDEVAHGQKILKLRGAIFLLGLLCAAAGRLGAQKRNLTPRALALTASSFMRPSQTGLPTGSFRGSYSLSMPDLELELDPDGDSEGKNKRERYALYGVDGCLGEAERGFPITLAAVEIINKLADAASEISPSLSSVAIASRLPAQLPLRSLREQAAHALLYILSENPDAALAGTNGIDGLTFVQDMARKALSAGGMLSSEGRDAIAAMDRELRAKNIIPIGSEAVLAAALLIRDLGKLHTPK